MFDWCRLRCCRIMERFSERYHEENPGVFSCSDTAWVLSFGLMILNTDMYNRNIKVSVAACLCALKAIRRMVLGEHI